MPRGSERKPEVLVVIPARGDSKGIPRKNCIALGGKPLLAWSVEAALESKMVTRVIVSTDDAEVAEVARGAGAELPFMRPAELAGERSSCGDVIDFTLERLAEQGYEADVLVQLFPTSPFRRRGLIDMLVSKLLEGFVELRTVKAVDPERPGAFEWEGRGWLNPVSGAELSQPKARQYRPYGLVVARNFRPFQPFKLHYHVIEDPLELVDIDTPADLLLAERLIRSGVHRRWS